MDFWRITAANFKHAQTAGRVLQNLGKGVKISPTGFNPFFFGKSENFNFGGSGETADVEKELDE